MQQELRAKIKWKFNLSTKLEPFTIYTLFSTHPVYQVLSRDQV